MNIEGWTKSLSSYSPLTDQLVTNLAAAIRPVAYILLGIFFLLELLELSADNRLQGNSVTPKQLASTAFAFAMGFVLINQSDMISNAILDLANILVTKADRSVKSETFDILAVMAEIGKVKGWVWKVLLTSGAGITYFLGEVIVNIQVMMRYFQLYIAKAIAPLAIAFIANRTLRSITINHMKLFGAYALHGLILLLIIRIYPRIITNEMLQINSVGTWQNIFGVLSSITKGWIFIALVLGSGRYIKQFMGVS